MQFASFKVKIQMEEVKFLKIEIRPQARIKEPPPDFAELQR
jgi:hypothetical protein